MPETELTQAEADALFALEKHRVDETIFTYPRAGQALVIPLVSADRREAFLLDIRHGRIDVRHATFQNRARGVVILARLDLGGPPHRNPDGIRLPCPYLHLYREGYADKWAFAVPSSAFADIDDHWTTLADFMRYCGITRPPHFQRTLT